MPLPMVHFWVAVRMAQARGTFPSREFLLGSIAPDAVHVRPDYERAYKRRSHLNDPPDSEDHARVRDFVVEHVRDTGANDAAARYAIGYAAHVLTDRLWLQRVYNPFRERNQHLTREELRSLYYQETDQIDFNLYHGSRWREPVWKVLEAVEAPDEVQLVTPSEVDQWRCRTLRRFTELKDEPGIVPREITDEMVAEFVAEACSVVAEQFAKWKVAVHC